MATGQTDKKMLEEEELLDSYITSYIIPPEKDATDTDVGTIKEKLKGEAMSLTDKEILDFVRENLTLGKDKGGHYTLKEVSCDVERHVYGNVGGDVVGDVGGHVVGDIVGTVYGDVYGNVDGNVVGNVKGSIKGNVIGG